MHSVDMNARQESLLIEAAVCTEGQALLEITTLKLSPPGAGEVLVRITAAGLCHTDIAIIDGARPGGSLDAPIVLGHEGSGHVVAVGENVKGIAAGDAVVLSFRSCGECTSCAHDHSGYCEHFLPLNFTGRRMDGTVGLSSDGAPVLSEFFGQSSFATHAVVAASSVVKVDSSSDLALLGPLGCGFQTGAGAVLNVLRPTTGSSFLLLGAGSVGLAALMAAHISGCGTIIAVDRDTNRLDMALSLGATHVLPAPVDDLPAAIAAITGRGADAALDTTGNGDLVAAAFASLAPWGRCGYVGIRTPEVTLSSRQFMRGCTLHGVMEGDSNPVEFIPALIAHYQAGRFPIDRLVRFYPFAQINDAIADMRAGRTIKPVVLLPN